MSAKVCRAHCEGCVYQRQPARISTDWVGARAGVQSLDFILLRITQKSNELANPVDERFKACKASMNESGNLSSGLGRMGSGHEL